MSRTDPLLNQSRIDQPLPDNPPPSAGQLADPQDVKGVGAVAFEEGQYGVAILFYG